LVEHGSFKTYEIYKARVILKIAPALQKKSSIQLIFTILMIALAAGAGIFGGIYTDGYGIHHPTQLIGICPPPNDFITSKGCYTTIIEPVVVKGVSTEENVTVPAGYLVFPNGTRFS
jgi:hypothetical protein